MPLLQRLPTSPLEIECEDLSPTGWEIAITVAGATVAAIVASTIGMVMYLA